MLIWASGCITFERICGVSFDTKLLSKNSLIISRKGISNLFLFWNNSNNFLCFWHGLFCFYFVLVFWLFLVCLFLVACFVYTHPSLSLIFQVTVGALSMIQKKDPS